MKTIILYYTVTGNNERIANELSKKFKADIIRIQAPPLLPFGDSWINPPDTSGYNRVIVSGPVWVGRPCPAVMAVLKRGGLEKKKVDVILTQMDPKNTLAIELVKETLPNAKVHRVHILGDINEQLKALLKKM